MAAKKKKADESKFLLRKELTLEQVCNILDEVIAEYLKDTHLISFSALITQHKLYKTKLQYWKTIYPNAVGERYNILQDIRESRIEEMLTTPKGKSDKIIPVANGIFYAKTCGMIEYDKVQNNDGNKLNIDEDITIGFDEEEEQDD